MPLFDRYIAVDWSAANSPKRGKDLIWIGDLGPAGRVPSENPPTRHVAMDEIVPAGLLAALESGRARSCSASISSSAIRAARAEAIAGTARLAGRSGATCTPS